MRNRTGCEPCRKSHTKCVRIEGQAKCNKCATKDRDCISASSYSFKEVKSILLKSQDGRSTTQDLRYEQSQVWVKLSAPVRFAAVNEDLEALDGLEDEDLLDAESGLLSRTPRNGQFVFPIDCISRPSSAAGVDGTFAYSNKATGQSQHTSAPVYGLSEAASSTGNASFPFSPKGYDGSFHSSPLANIASPSFSIPTSVANWPFNTAHEARLFHHYIQHVSPWVDICDKHRLFGTEVPKRASSYPVIVHGIYVVASRSLCLLSGVDDNQSQKYMSDCLQMMIATLDDPLAHWDENFLAAIILMRIHEEVGLEDRRFHLLGSTKMLNSIASFASGEGLRESSSWISLRQHIYISLTSQHPLPIDLTNFRSSHAFQELGDEDWANRMIYCFANILTHVFGAPAEQTFERWKELDEDVETFFRNKPWSYQPMWVSEVPNESEARVWPLVLMLHPAHVIGLQYYHMSKMTLSIYDPRLSELGFRSLALRKSSERTVVRHLKMVIGLAVSNDSVANAQFNASHSLQTCGSYLEDRREQKAALELLGQIQKRIGWKTRHIAKELKEQWHL